MLKFYYHPAPNPLKVALFLEESGLPYQLVPVDVRKGEQFAPDYLSVNPNGKVPAIDDDGTLVFDSNAILLYLAEKTGKFLPGDNSGAARGPMLSWLMFIASGVGPYSGQAVHFKMYAPEPMPYASNRYNYETKRHFRLLDDQLAKAPYLLGSTYTLVDMAAWGWVRMIPFILGDGALGEFVHLEQWFARINARPAAIRAEALKDRHRFAETADESAMRVLFAHMHQTA